MEFTDFQCPFCARHATQTVEKLKEQFKGKVRYAVVNLPLPIHAQATAAAEAAECAAAQGKYWEMHDLLFQEQKNFATADFVALGERLGLDRTAFEACVKSGVKAAIVKADQAEANRLGVRATPSLFLGRMRSDGGVDLLRRVGGAVSFDTFVAEVANLWRKSRKVAQG